MPVQGSSNIILRIYKFCSELKSIYDEKYGHENGEQPDISSMKDTGEANAVFSNFLEQGHTILSHHAQCMSIQMNK